MSKILAILLLTFVFVGYQNCGKQMNFSDANLVDKVSAGGDSVIIPIDDSKDPVIHDGDNNSSEDLAEDDSQEPQPEAQPGVIDNEEEQANNNNSNDNSNDDVKDNSSDYSNDDVVSDVAQGPQTFICILEGNGKSQRLGFTNQALFVNNKTPLTVCMSEHACLNIVSKKYEVKSAEDGRGFCKNAKADTIPLSDEELENLVK